MVTVQSLLNELNSLFSGWEESGHPYTDDIHVSHEHFSVTYSARYKDYRSVSNVITFDETILKGYSAVSATESVRDLKKQIKEQLDLIKSIYESMEGNYD